MPSCIVNASTFCVGPILIVNLTTLIQERNKKQIEAMNAFESKCQRLYEGRLMSHEENTREMLADYEEKLMMQVI